MYIVEFYVKNTNKKRLVWIDDCIPCYKETKIPIYAKFSNMDYGI